MRIATFNINGIKARTEALGAWLDAAAPDVVLLQEIKSVDEAFPHAAFRDRGYFVETHGQKGFNGVAILSKLTLEEVNRGLPGDDADPQSRYIEALAIVPSGALRFASLYLPNGNPIGTEKFAYKLAWMQRLESHARSLLALEEPFALVGDYNVIPDKHDARRPEAWTGDALFQPESRGAWRELCALGLTDATRACHPEPGLYTGIRIDHILLSPQAADRLVASGIDKHTRSWEKPSDHVPVWAMLEM
jgi:exodeoxyribonuclease-3